MTRKALSLRQFADLPQELQLEALHRNGAYVGKRKINDQVVLLYQLHGFYVELYYREYRKKIDRLITSDDPDILLPYLDQIKVKGLGDSEAEQ